MAFEAKHRSQMPPEYWDKPEELARKLSQSIRGLLNGQSNNHFEVTLESGETQTVGTFNPARPGVAVLVTPCNQAAAAFARANDVWTSSGFGTVTVHSSAAAAGTEVFSLAIFG